LSAERPDVWCTSVRALRPVRESPPARAGN
jgi:hypothetical protein